MTTYEIRLTVNDEGVWLAKTVFLRDDYIYNERGELSDTPEKAVLTLLKTAGIETRTGAMVLEAAE
jgi:hypothetical protein